MYTIGIVFAFLSALFISLSNVLVQRGFAGINQRYGVFITILFSFVSVAVISIADGELGHLGQIGITAALLFAFVGFLNFTMGRLLKYTSIGMSGPSTTGAFISLRIVFAILFSAILIHEQLTGYRMLGDALVFIGLITVTMNNGFKKDRISKGILIAILAAAFLGLSDVVVSIAVSLYHFPLAGLMISYMAGLVTFLPMLVPGRNSSEVKIPGKSIVGFLALIGLFAGIAQASRFFSLSMTPVSVAVPVIALSPAITMIISFIWLKTEKIGTLFVAGISLAVAGAIFLAI